MKTAHTTALISVVPAEEQSKEWFGTAVAVAVATDSNLETVQDEVYNLELYLDKCQRLLTGKTSRMPSLLNGSVFFRMEIYAKSRAQVLDALSANCPEVEDLWLPEVARILDGNVVTYYVVAKPSRDKEGLNVTFKGHELSLSRDPSNVMIFDEYSDTDYVIRCMEEMGMDVAEGDEPFAPESVLSNREGTYDGARQGYIVTAELRDGEAS